MWRGQVSRNQGSRAAAQTAAPCSTIHKGKPIKGCCRPNPIAAPIVAFKIEKARGAPPNRIGRVKEVRSLKR